MIVIFFLSSIPMDGGSDNIAFLTNLNPGLQNFLHIPLFGFLSFLWMNYFVSRKWRLNRAILLAIIITIGFGCLDEIHQSFVPGRYGGLMDIILNSVGAILGVGFFWILNRKAA